MSNDTDTRRECCRDEDNLELVSDEPTPTGSIAKHRCRECGRNHYVAVAVPIKMGVTGASAGG